MKIAYSPYINSAGCLKLLDTEGPQSRKVLDTREATTVPWAVEERVQSERQLAVYCSASREAHPAVFAAAETLGAELATADVTLVYGGGAEGPMGVLAEAVLVRNGRVVGVMPRFMHELGWSHPELTELRLVETMHERKATILRLSDGLIVLPGGTGTLEEMMEALAWKRLGLFAGPISLVNTLGFFEPVLRILDHAVELGFMIPEHARLFSVVARTSEALSDTYGAGEHLRNGLGRTNIQQREE